MAYIIGQYNHNYASTDDDRFMSAIESGTADRREDDSDRGVTGGTLSPFKDECVRVPGGFEANTTYYFRGQIKRMTSAQIFNIKLVNYEVPDPDKEVQQFIKQIVVQGGDYNEWVSVELVFTPVEGTSFDTILFQLQRTIDDYRVMTRYSIIDYQQLSKVNNMIENMAGNGINKLLKIGVQSHPGLMMCVNQEEIHMSRTGIFEIRNGVLPIQFFSVVNAASETTADVETWKIQIDAEVADIESYEPVTPEEGDNPSAKGWYEYKDMGDGKYSYVLTKDTTVESGKTYYLPKYPSPSDKEEKYAALSSACFFDKAKQYKIDAFTLDYMYNKNT